MSLYILCQVCVIYSTYMYMYNPLLIHVQSTSTVHVYIMCEVLCVFFTSVTAFPDVKYGKRIHVLPIDDSVEGITG